ncbi:MAG: iron transporter [Pseudonocardiaceae bacterium]
MQSLVLALPLALAVTACSGQGDSAPAAGEKTQAVPAGVAEQHSTMEKEIREAGGEQTVGPWRVGYIVEAAEPWHVLRDGRHTYRQPAPGETHHIEVLPIEAATGRVIPDVPIRLEVVDASGAVVDAQQLNFYYSTFFHYANNFRVPQPGTYTLRATLEPPQFFRHGEADQPVPLAEGATVTFTGVELPAEG